MNRHLLTLSDLGPEGFWALIDRADEIKQSPSRYMRSLYEKTLLMIFEAPSLRTRLSLETAMTQLHGHAINYYTVHSPWGQGKETIEDVSRTLSRYCDAVSARIFDHEELVKLAESSSVPVINAMTNLGHPCQILGDFLTIREKLGRTEGITLSYVGDSCNNVTYSLMRAAVLSGNELRIGCPDHVAYRPGQAVQQEIETLSARCSGRVELFSDPREAVAGADIIYTDSWMSYRVPPEEKEQRLRDLQRFQVDEGLMDAAAEGARFMHCLPAMRGQEVTADVIDGPRSIVFDQAENRLHIEKAILLDLIGEADPPPQ
jgi:ornithine carbamoyltransferase